MRVERLGGDKIRFFLTLDDLVDRGIEKEDMWRDVPKVHELFNDMMEHAYQELGFEVVGPVAVEVFALPAQGMVVVVTRGRTHHSDHDQFDEDEIYELEVTMEESNEIVFMFNDFEHVVQAASSLHPIVSDGGKLYFYRDAYYLVFDNDMLADQIEKVIAILSEYGEASTVTDTVLSEYGKTVCSQDAINQMKQYFG
jgi:adapter protein MecA 1/2